MNPISLVLRSLTLCFLQGSYGCGAAQGLQVVPTVEGIQRQQHGLQQ